MAVVISEFEVVATEPDVESESETPSIPRRPAESRLAPRDVIRIVERNARRRLRVRAH